MKLDDRFHNGQNSTLRWNLGWRHKSSEDSVSVVANDTEKGGGCWADKR